MDPNTMGLPSGAQTNPSTGPVGAPMNGYRCGSNTSSSSGRGSSIQHASLPRHFNAPPTQMGPPTVNDPTQMGLPTVSAHIPLQHHNMTYMRPYRGHTPAPPPPPPQCNSHYRGQ